MANLEQNKDALVLEHVKASLTKHNGSLYEGLEKAEKLEILNERETLAAAFKESLKANFGGFVEQYKKITNPKASGVSLDANITFRPDMSFPKFIQHATGLAPGEGKEALSALRPLFNALNINTSVATMQDLATQARLASSGTFNSNVADDNLRFLVMESFTQAIRTGISTQALWNRLIARTITVPNNMVNVPVIQAPYARMQEMGEAVDVGEGSWKYTIKNLLTKKYGFRVSLTDEIIAYIAFDLLAETMAELGRATDVSMNVQAIQTLLNGDGSNDPSPAVTVGVATTNTLAYTDLLRLVAEAGKHGLAYDMVMCNTDEYIRLTQLPEVRGYSGETKQLSLNLVNIPTLNNMTIMADPNIPEKKYLMVDTRRALVRVNENTGLTVEQERVAAKETSVYYVRNRGTWYREITEAAVLLDLTTAYAPTQTNWGANALLTQGYDSKL